MLIDVEGLILYLIGDDDFFCCVEKVVLCFGVNWVESC